MGTMPEIKYILYYLILLRATSEGEFRKTREGQCSFRVLVIITMDRYLTPETCPTTALDAYHHGQPARAIGTVQETV